MVERMGALAGATAPIAASMAVAAITNLIMYLYPAVNIACERN